MSEEETLKLVLYIRRMHMEEGRGGRGGKLPAEQLTCGLKVTWRTRPPCIHRAPAAATERR